MAKAQAIIELAFTLSGIKAIGNPLTGEELEHGLNLLNSKLSLWQAQGMYIPYLAEKVQTVTGSPVTIGTGQTINVPRPTNIRDTSFFRSNNIDYPIEWISEAEYNLLGNKTITSQYPYMAYYDNGLPFGRIYFYPVPVNVELHLQLDAILPKFTDYVTDYPIDNGWEHALAYTVAEESCIGIKEVPRQLKTSAMAARQAIMVNNLRIPKLRVPILERRGYTNPLL